MANFNDAYKRLGDIEGGYVNHPNDTGGETYAGISRRNWPKLQLWKILDDIKKQFTSTADINRAMQKNKLVSDLVKEFYKGNFWDVVHGDFIRDQKVAEEIFLQVYYSGNIVPTVRRVQDSCNFLIGCEKEAKWEPLIKMKTRIDNEVLHVINLIDSLKLSDVFLYDLKSRESARLRANIVSKISHKSSYAEDMRRVFKA